MKASTTALQHTPQTEVTQSVEVDVKTIPRTTAWRQRKRNADSLPQAPARRKYNCHVCGDTMSATAHDQYYDKWHCPKTLGQVPKDEWLAQRRAEKRQKNN